MIKETEEFWSQITSYLAKKYGFSSLSIDQAQKEFESLPDLPLSKYEINSIVDHVTSGEPSKWTMPEPFDDNSTIIDAEAMEQEIFQLNRNIGENDPETEKLLQELRRKAFEDGENDDKTDSTGIDGTSKPPGKSH